MRAVVIREFRKPWSVEEVPDPTPGPGQVLVKIEACGLCGTDVHIQHGAMPFVRTPCVPGHEPVGRIVALGAGVEHLRVGDRVGAGWNQKGCGRCEACQGGRFWFCRDAVTWITFGGGHAELMLAWAGGVTLVPDGIAPEDAAPMFCAGYTAISSLRMASPQPGERVAVVGIGGLGHLALQIAKAYGHEVVAVTGTEGKLAEARELGADVAIVAGEHAGKSLMAVGGADVIVCTSNSATHVSQALAGLRTNGRLVTAGALGEPIVVNSFELMFPPRSVIGGTQGDRKDLVDLLALVAKGKVKPRIETYPLDRVNEVLARQDAGKVRYRAVLQLGG